MEKGNIKSKSQKWSALKEIIFVHFSAKEH